MEAAGAGIATIIIIVVSVIFTVALTVGVFAMIKMIAKQNTGFIAQNSIVSQELPPGTHVSARFQPAPGRAHAVWIDVDLQGPTEMGFDLWLAVKVGPQAFIEGNFPVTFDNDGDAVGLPNTSGVAAMNTMSSSSFSGRSQRGILCAFRFNAPPMPASGEVHARIAPFPGTSFSKSRLLLTVGDSAT